MYPFISCLIVYLTNSLIEILRVWFTVGTAEPGVVCVLGGEGRLKEHMT